MKLLKKFFLLIFLFGKSMLFGQAIDIELENKYWNYKDRLNKYFTQIGDKNGQSLTAAQIFPENQFSDTWKIVNGVRQSANPKHYQNVMKFGDVVVDQGYYLAVLASELKLLILQSQQNTDRFKSVCNQLYFAIGALDRLDNDAENFLNPLQENKKNGFFIRSDNDEKFMSRYNRNNLNENLIIDLMSSGGANGPAVKFVDSITSSGIRIYDFDSFEISLTHSGPISWLGGPYGYGTTQNYANEMSQDQVFGMLMGFMCVKQWVPADLVVDPDGNLPLPSKNLHNWVAEITGRVVSFMSKNFDEKVSAKDISVQYEEIKNSNCEEIKKLPYWGLDTVSLIIPDTLYSIHFDTINSQIIIDTLLKYERILEVVDSLPFPGSIFRTCNLWQLAVDQYDKKPGFSIFKESNYIITNPIRNNKIVTRGHFAIPFGYPIREAAKYITNSDSFPQPSAQLSLESESIIYSLDLIGAYLATSYHFQIYGANTINKLKFIFDQLLLLQSKFHLLSGNAKKIADATFQINDNCPNASVSLDAICLCLIGRPIEPQYWQFWRDLWNALPQKEFFRILARDNFTANLQHNLALASRTWSHDIFSDWCDTMGFKNSEIFYAMLHGGNPKKSKNFYQNILMKAQKEGIFHAGDPNPNQSQIDPYAIHEPFTRDNIFSNVKEHGEKSTYGYAQAGLDYMLLFNLYKMADLTEWKSGSFKTNDLQVSNCPCVSYPDIPIPSLHRSIFEKIVNNKNDTIGGLVYANKPAFMPEYSLVGTTKRIEPLLDYYQNYQIRIPNYLLHNLTISGNNLVFNPTDGILEVAQDLTVCNGNLKIDQHGKLKMLDGVNSDFPSKLIITKGSVIEIKNNGILEIGNHCQLIIEQGGKLIVNSGAKLILNGDDAIVHVKGILELNDDVKFEILGGSNGKGYLIWENSWNNVTNNNSAFLIVHNHCSIKLQHENSSKRILKVLGNAGFNTNWNLEKFEIIQARVDLGPESYIMCESKNNFFDTVDVYGFMDGHANSQFNYKPCSNGIHVMGVKNHFNHMLIKDCLVGLKLFNVVGVNEQMKISDVDFLNCSQSLINHGGRLIYENGSIYHTSGKQMRTGITGIGTQGNTILKNVNISLGNDSYMANCEYPLLPGETVNNIWCHGTGRYQLTKCNINSADRGVIINQGYLIPKCTNFQNNQYQVIMMQGSSFTILNNGWNKFSWYQADTTKKFFKGTNGVYLYLNNGNNYIMGYNSTANTKFLEAELHYSFPFVNSTGASGTNLQAIEAKGNQWAIGGSGGIYTEPAISGVANVKLTVSGVANTYVDLNYLPTFSSNFNQDQENYCTNFTNNISWWPIDSICIDKVNSAGFNGALVSRRSDSLQNQLMAIPINYSDVIEAASSLFHTAVPDNVGATFIEIYSKIQSLYPEVFIDSNIPDAIRPGVIQSTYSKMLLLQQQLINLAEATSPNVWQLFRFEVHRDLALIHRVFNARNTSIQYLNVIIPTFNKPSDVISLEAWRCLIEKEQNYIDSLIPYWQVSFDTCLVGIGLLSVNDTVNTEWAPDWRNRNYSSQNSSEMRVLNTEKIDNQNLPSEIVIFPNPTNDFLTIQANEPVHTVELFTNTGILIFKLKMNTRLGNVDLRSLSEGLYLVKVQTINSNKSFKVMKIN